MCYSPDDYQLKGFWKYEQYCWLIMSKRQDNWDKLLLFMEFQYNSQAHSMMQETLFMLDTGWHPQMGFKPDQANSGIESVNEFRYELQYSVGKYLVWKPMQLLLNEYLSSKEERLSSFELRLLYSTWHGWLHWNDWVTLLMWCNVTQH